MTDDVKLRAPFLHANSFLASFLDIPVHRTCIPYLLHTMSTPERNLTDSSPTLTAEITKIALMAHITPTLLQHPVCTTGRVCQISDYAQSQVEVLHTLNTQVKKFLQISPLSWCHTHKKFVRTSILIRFFIQGHQIFQAESLKNEPTDKKLQFTWKNKTKSVHFCHFLTPKTFRHFCDCLFVTDVMSLPHLYKCVTSSVFTCTCA